MALNLLLKALNYVICVCLNQQFPTFLFCVPLGRLRNYIKCIDINENSKINVPKKLNWGFKNKVLYVKPVKFIKFFMLVTFNSN